jgi:hypothetical protein
MCLEKLLKVVAPVAKDEDGYQEWLEQSSFFNLLAEQREGASTILYGTGFNHSSLLIQSLLIPMEDLDKAEPEDMMTWDSPHDSWSCGLVYGGGQPPRVEYTEPLARNFPKEFRGGQRLVFGRSFPGRIEDKHYYEIAHFLTHAHDLHWTPERRAWCRFDENGDVVEVIRWAAEAGRAGYGAATCITIDREVLEMQMSASGTALVQMFDVTTVGKGFFGWNDREAI